MGTCSRSRLQTPHKTSYRQSVTRVHVWRCGPEGGHQVRPPHDRTTLLQCATSGATRHCCVLHCYDFTCPFQKESKQKHTQTHCTVVQALDLQSNARKPPFPCGMPSSLNSYSSRTNDPKYQDDTLHVSCPGALNNTVVSSMVEI